MKTKFSFLLMLGLLILSTTVASAKAEMASPSPKPKQNEVQNRNQVRTTATPSASPIKEQEREQVRERDKQGAQFSLANGVVTLTTPSGKTHELKLPEQAIENMQRNGFFNTPVASDESEINQIVPEKKKLLGLIPVEINMQLTIDTKTGEMTYVPKSGLMRFFKFLFTQ